MQPTILVMIMPLHQSKSVVCKLIIIYVITFLCWLDPSQCQVGQTNNCTQICERDPTSGVHNCSCYAGFEIKMGSDSVCVGISLYCWLNLNAYNMNA